MRKNNNDRVVRLMEFFLLGTITEEERKELEDWCALRVKNRLFFERMCREKVFAKEHSIYQKIDIDRAIRRFELRVKDLRGSASGYFTIRRWWGYAAILMLPILVLCIWRWEYIETLHPAVSSEAIEICPGSSRAILVLDNGRRLELGSKDRGEISLDRGVTAICKQGQLEYVNQVMTDSSVVRYDCLEIPRGAEYKVTLSDGTLVYLNSSTRLKYPQSFRGACRKVYLSGEAYFDVTKNPQSPFLVEVEGVEIKVYGTSFNVNSFRDGSVQTVLVEGSVGVKVLKSGEERFIEPGQLADIDKVHGKVTVKEVNTGLYTDWKEGIFRFEDQRLEDILMTLSNWYNVEIFYQNPEVKKLHFSGYMERYEEFQTILEAITLSTGVKFNVEGKTIIVSK